MPTEISEATYRFQSSFSDSFYAIHLVRHLITRPYVVETCMMNSANEWQTRTFEFLEAETLLTKSEECLSRTASDSQRQRCHRLRQ